MYSCSFSHLSSQYAWTFQWFLIPNPLSYSCGLPFSFVLGSILLFFLSVGFVKSCFAEHPICLGWGRNYRWSGKTRLGICHKHFHKLSPLRCSFDTTKEFAGFSVDFLVCQVCRVNACFLSPNSSDDRIRRKREKQRRGKTQFLLQGIFQAVGFGGFFWLWWWYFYFSFRWWE